MEVPLCPAHLNTYRRIKKPDSCRCRVSSPSLCPAWRREEPSMEVLWSGWSRRFSLSPSPSHPREPIRETWLESLSSQLSGHENASSSQPERAANILQICSDFNERSSSKTLPTEVAISSSQNTTTTTKQTQNKAKTLLSPAVVRVLQYSRGVSSFRLLRCFHHCFLLRFCPFQGCKQTTK